MAVALAILFALAAVATYARVLEQQIRNRKNNCK